MPFCTALLNKTNLDGRTNALMQGIAIIPIKGVGGWDGVRCQNIKWIYIHEKYHFLHWSSNLPT